MPLYWEYQQLKNKNFWHLLDEALKGLVERDHPHTSRKYRNNDPVTVVNY